MPLPEWTEHVLAPYGVPGSVFDNGSRHQAVKRDVRWQGTEMESEQQHFPRDPTQDERTLTAWIIEHGTSDAENYLGQLSHAKVSGCCNCGCASIDFQVANRPPPKSHALTILGDFIFEDEEGHTCGCFVFAKDGNLAGLEVYALEAQTSPKTLPRPESLRKWENRFHKSHRT